MGTVETLELQWQIFRNYSLVDNILSAGRLLTDGCYVTAGCRQDQSVRALLLISPAEKESHQVNTKLQLMDSFHGDPHTL